MLPNYQFKRKRKTDLFSAIPGNVEVVFAQGHRHFCQHLCSGREAATSQWHFPIKEPKKIFFFRKCCLLLVGLFELFNTEAHSELGDDLSTLHPQRFQPEILKIPSENPLPANLDHIDDFLPFVQSVFISENTWLSEKKREFSLFRNVHVFPFHSVSLVHVVEAEAETQILSIQLLSRVLPKNTHSSNSDDLLRQIYSSHYGHNYSIVTGEILAH